jgi:hypothetical protein
MFLKSLEEASRKEFAELTAETFMKALSLMGYDGITLGRADLLLPAALLERLADKAPFPVLAANLRTASGEAPFPATLVKEIGGRRVGVFGVVGEKPLPPPAGAGDFRPGEPTAAARRAVAELRKSCELVIALSSLGLEEDARLAREVPGIDLILGSDSRAQTNPPRLEGETCIVHTGAKGMRVGRLAVELDPDRRGPWTEQASAPAGAPRVYRWSLVPLDANQPDHPAVFKLLDGYREELRRRNLLEQKTAAPPPPTSFPTPYVGAAACGACHPDQLRQWSGSAHARAVASLARKKQDTNPECLRCHVTAYGELGGYAPGSRSAPLLANVQCEACHGFGRDHRGPGRIRGAVSEAVCRRCHTGENSPTFQYEAYLRKLDPHAARHFARPGLPQRPEAPVR